MVMVTVMAKDDRSNADALLLDIRNHLVRRVALRGGADGLRHHVRPHEHTDGLLRRTLRAQVIGTPKS